MKRLSWRGSFPSSPEKSEEIYRMHLGVKLVYKTENPTHPQCQPKNGVQNTMTRDNTRLVFGKVPHAWENMFVIEDRFIPFAAQYNMSLFQMDSLFARQDAHPQGDCLHYCLPGPLNLFARMMQHFLAHGEAQWRAGVRYRNTLLFPWIDQSSFLTCLLLLLYLLLLLLK